MSYEIYTEHFEPLIPPQDVFPTAQYQLANCPIVHSDVDNQGFWVVNPHGSVLRLLQDWSSFECGMQGVVVPEDPPGLDRPFTPPITSNPPIHRDFRVLINPFFSPTRVAEYEPAIRRIIGEVLDDALAGDHCDIATQFAKVFPARTTFEVLFGIGDSDELTKVLGWVRRLHHKHLEPGEEMVLLQRQFDDWVMEYITERRRAPRRNDLIDTLLYGVVDDGRSISDAELNGVIQGIIGGGFNTSSDATCNIVIALIDQPGLEDRLRSNPDLIPHAIEEVLRLDPPISTRPRRCTETVEIDGNIMQKGDRVLVNLVAANIDPSEFDYPMTFDIDRPHNRHLAFGAGRHRCVGSNFARSSLRIMTEELLARIRNIEFALPSREVRVSFGPNSWRRIESLGIRFTPVRGLQR